MNKPGQLFADAPFIGVDMAKGADRTVITLTRSSDKSRVKDAIAYLQAKYPGARIIVREPDGRLE